MNVIDQLGIALGLATLAGLNLYLTVLVTGLAVRFEWIELSGAYANLEVLAHPWVIAVAGGLFLIEFFADKIPWVDSFWDLGHAIIRPAGAVVLSLAVLGDLDPVVVAIATILAGSAALATHGTKSGVRTVLNMSPEPISNSVASVAEDSLVLGGLGLIAFAPAVALVVFTGVAILCGVIGVVLWKRIIRLARRRMEPQQNA